MGEVYLANDATLRRPVAIKVLRADLLADKDRMRRFEREAQTASSLNHPNILTIYEIDRDEERHFIVTEFIDGYSLRQQVEREPLKLPDVLEIGIQVASALAAAHAAGIVHRDIKPDNIMLRRDRLVKVLDFGLAKLSEPETRNEGGDAERAQEQFDTVPGVVMGTPRYMSPEQARGLPVDARTDIWSLGVVLYQMTTGTLPFSGDTPSDIIVEVLVAEPRDLTLSVPEVPAELQRIVKKTLSKNREDRYQAVTDLERDLKGLKEQLEFEAQLERSGHVTPTIELAPATAHSGAHTASSTGYLLGAIKRHKREALILSTLILAALSYFAYTRFTGGAGSGITSLAVLPFMNLSNDPEKEYLSDGIAESLINRLSQLPGVKVIANSSSSRYKGKDTNPVDVARALDTTGILTGRISQLGDRLSISVELIDGRDSTHVWGERYDRNATDLLAVQAEISREITEKLRLRLTTGQRQQLSAGQNVNPEAYELLLKGYFFRSRGSADDRKRAGEYFQQAVARDPGYALAHAELSDIYRSLVGSSILDPKEYLPKAEQAAQKAIELDDSLADAHNALANLKTYLWEWDDAEREYKRAIELNPNLALAHRWYASFLRLMGRHEGAIAEIKRARELDPLSPGVNATVGYLFFNARQYDQAIEALKETLELDQNYPYTHLFLGFTYAAKGMYEEAIAEYQKAIKLGLDTPATQIFLSAAYAKSGDRPRAQAILQQLQRGKEPVSPGNLAILYAALGEREQAFVSLEKAYQSRDPQLQYLGVEPGFDPLRSDKRFEDLLRRIGLSR